MLALDPLSVEDCRLLVGQALGLELVLQCPNPTSGAVHRRIHEDALRCHTLSYLGPETGGAVGLLEVAVDDGVDAGLQDVGHGLRGDAVGRGVLAELMDLLADGGQLLYRERGSQREGRPGASAGGGNLDEVRALLHELAYRGAALVGPGGLHSEVAQVSADNRHRPA